jgi:hypothetical protein
MRTLHEVLADNDVPEDVIADQVLMAKERAFEGEDPVVILAEFGIEIPEFCDHQIMPWC